MSYRQTPLIVLLITLLCCIEPTFAGNRIELIGGGVAGANSEKLALLHNIAMIVGGFMVLLGIVSLATRKRYEGMVMMARKGELSPVVLPSVFLIVVGCLVLLLTLL